ncbi:MAG: DUF2852 domain-containing protein [Rhizobiales bacterium]|nr:DUF2852 domain-containing protein [Hyphomicrobiales bacterium]MBI3674322.1 DUF2852 domain-containing protein [Hyphomicrobiales bacterium]
MTASASGTYEGKFDHGRCGGRFARNPWSVWEIAAMVAGFVVFWPLGLLALFLKWKNGEMWRGASEAKAPWSGMRKPDFAAWKHYRHDRFGGTGNAAFDDYRKAALDRLEEERRKLEEESRAFRDFLDKLRRAKDQEEFDRFMAERQRPDPGATA